MHVWHNTPDAPRMPAHVSPGQSVDVTIGTWPVAAGQSVHVWWRREPPDGPVTEGTVDARWDRNAGVNSYWGARLGSFVDGERVTYVIRGSSPDAASAAGPFTFRVRPRLYVAWLWHHHQPLYRDPTVATQCGSYKYPWVRLHALRDYYSMAALASAYDVHVTFNFTPVLLRQLDDYLVNGATDRALDLTRTPADRLTPREQRELLSTFFDVDWHRQLYVHPRYRELFARRTAGARFSPQEVCDLQMWFNLAWFGHEFRQAAVRLATGDVVDVARFVAQARTFTHDQVLSMVDEQYKVMRAVVPLHRALQQTGRIEVTTTPAYHPILPLLIDSDVATLDRPGAARPMRYAHPDDASDQVKLAHADYQSRFGHPPAGMWPAEGAVSRDAVRLLAGHAVRWIATDAGVLARSGRWGYRIADPAVLCQPYAPSDAPELAIFFRDTDLSDGVGFRYGPVADPDVAVSDLLRTIETRYLECLPVDDQDYVLTIVLDGENAWGGYVDDGRPFLHALYRHLSSDARLCTVTFSEYLQGNPARGIVPHAGDQLARMHDLATGSWIDEPGSAPGVDLGTWIGEPEENVAWTLLGQARAHVEGSLGNSRARDSLLAAQGSDWFWWFGTDQESRNDATFDDLFRAHLRGAYRALDLEPPEALEDFIVARPRVWTFTHPIAAIPRAAQVSIRTNCPGHLVYCMDGAREQTTHMVPVGGVMAGVRRFQVTLGPFATSAHRLDFRFVCEHVGCPHDSPCCRTETHTIAIGRAGRPAAARATAAAKNSQGAHHADHS